MLIELSWSLLSNFLQKRRRNLRPRDWFVNGCQSFPNISQLNFQLNGEGERHRLGPIQNDMSDSQDPNRIRYAEEKISQMGQEMNGPIGPDFYIGRR